MLFVFPVIALVAALVAPLATEGASALKSAFESSALASEPSKLGDLSKFRSLANDVRLLVEKNDLEGGKKRIKDLESSWDEAEAGLKPRAGKDWRKLDKAIDTALDALRESKPKQTDCKKAIDGVIATIDELAKT